MNQPTALESRERWTYLGLALFLALLWFATLSLRPLFNPDEGRYAEIAREMLAGGDWVIPHLNGLAYIEKPPLQYWATALALRVFGQSEFAARFYTACCALATLLTVWFLARRLWSIAAAWRAAAMLASMMLFLVMGQLLTLDMGLTLYLTAALAGFVLAQTGPRRPSELGWMLFAWVAAALGVLSKGLVAAAIPAAVLVSYSAWARDFSPWRRLHVAWGLPLFLAIAVPWHWLAARRLADFAQFFFVHEHLARYLTPSANREEPWWYFGAVLALGSVPWTLSVMRVMVLGWRRREPGGGFNPSAFLWIWAWFVCIFFSLSESKLIPYILPSLPAIALLIASLPADVLRRDMLTTAVLTLIAAAALAMLCMFAPRFVAASDRSEYFLSLTKPVAQIAALLAASGLYVLSQRRREVTRSAVFLGVGWCLSGLLMMRAAAAVAPVYSGVKLAQALPADAENAPIYSVGTYDQTLPFYWHRGLVLVAYRGELDYGLRYNPGAELGSVAEFIARWNGESDAYAVMEKAMYQSLKGQGVAMREVGRDANRVLVARR
ncbi:MAG: phospholipid carrier-dependent glycosyltransferase [Steroidobacteraceae bacterium]